MEVKGTLSNQNILKRKNKVGRFTPPYFKKLIQKYSNQNSVIQYWHKDNIFANEIEYRAQK